MKPSAYISEGGVVFKEIPPNLMFNLTPLYTSPEIQYWHNLVKDQDKKIFELKTALEYANKTNELRSLVKSFFDDYLSIREESDSGRIFSPIYVSCCRAMKIESLSKLMDRMMELSGAKREEECKILLKSTLKV
jgi:hypothetical protein